MSLQQYAPHARRAALVVVLGCAGIGALILGVTAEVVIHYTQPHTPKGAPR